MSGLNIVGSSRSDATVREENDYYATSPFAIDSLLQFEKIPLDSFIWENACGEGNLSIRLVERGYSNIFSSDLIDRGYGHINNFLFSPDFYYLKNNRKPEYIITNPPYKYAKDWVLKSLNSVTSDGKVIMLLKLVFLESQNRKELFDLGLLRNIYVFRKRLGVYKNNIKSKNDGLIAYAWFVWDKSYSGNPQINWI
jgi:hypothetical protein